ncbi:MAG: peptidoglycan DD-metalloendopeptidase family protein [Patescibacteria group bacterium]
MKRIKNTFSKSFFKASVIVALFVMFFAPQNFLRAQTNQELRDQINNLSSQKDTLSSEVATYDAQINALQQQLNQTESELSSLVVEIDQTNQQITKTEEDLKVKKETLNEYMRVIYEESNTSPLELVASSDSFSDFVDRSEYLQTMQIKIKDMVVKIKQMKEELDKKKKDLEKQKDRVQSLKSQQASVKAGLDQQRAQKETNLSQVMGDEKKLRGELSKRMSAGYSYCKGGGGVIRAKNPIFKFPLDCGYISQGFGMTEFAREGSYGGQIHNGIDVAQIGAGTAIMAIGPGTVHATGTSPSGGWGNWVVVKHGNGYYSLYAHMISPSYLSPGDTVNTGDVVGGVGGTPYWPIHLHFSLYTSDPGPGPSYPGNTVDPLDYMDIPISTGGTDWGSGHAH